MRHLAIGMVLQKNITTFFVATCIITAFVLGSFSPSQAGMHCMVKSDWTNHLTFYTFIYCVTLLTIKAVKYFSLLARYCSGQKTVSWDPPLKIWRPNPAKLFKAFDISKKVFKCSTEFRQKLLTSIFPKNVASSILTWLFSRVTE